MIQRAINLPQEELLARIAKLEAEVARLTEVVNESSEMRKKLGRFTGKVNALWEGFIEYRSERNKWFEDAFDRIMNLEMFVFPNLVRDLDSVHSIIGSDAPKTPLDVRK